MTFDDHWADTRTRLQLWATQLGFIDEGDGEDGFRFVLGGEDPMCSHHLGAIHHDMYYEPLPSNGCLDADPSRPNKTVCINLLVYFISHLNGQLVVSLPVHGMGFCSIQAWTYPAPGRGVAITDDYRDKEEIFSKYQYAIEEMILGLFQKQLNKCRRALIRVVK